MARQFFKKGAVALLDNEDENKVVDAGAPADNANSLETDMVEVADSAAEGEAEDAVQDEAVDTKEALEHYKTALEAYIAEGGIDQKAARLMNIGLEHLSERQGFKDTGAGKISLESFSGVSSRGRGTALALEDIKERIAKVWEAIKAAIKRAVEWLKDHWNKMFGAGEKLKKRAEGIVAKAKDITGSAKEQKFENERLVKALHVGGSVPAQLSAALSGAGKVAQDVFGHTADFGAKSGEAALETLQKADGKIDDIVAIAYSSNVLKPLSASEATAAGFEAAPDGLELFRSAELPGGKAILGRFSTKSVQGEAAVKVYTGTTSALTPFSNKAAEVSKTELATLSAAEISKVAETVIELAGELISYRAKAGKAGEMKTKIVAACDKLEKAAPKEDDKDKAAYMTALQKVAQASASALDKPAPQFAQYLLVIGKSALDYAEESMKQYSK